MTELHAEMSDSKILYTTQLGETRGVCPEATYSCLGRLLVDPVGAEISIDCPRGETTCYVKVERSQLQGLFTEVAPQADQPVEH
jgi:hypothetical protein